jgi:hypothetical protein
MPQLRQQGGLDKVTFACINSDTDSELASKLMRGQTIPQLIVFCRTNDGWNRQQLTGAQSVDATRQFIAQAAEKPVAQVSSRK